MTLSKMERIFMTQTKTVTNTVSPKNIPVALANFDHLPDSAHVRLPVVQALYACSPASIWRGIKAGRIPCGKKLSPRTTCWLVRDLREALAKS